METEFNNEMDGSEPIEMADGTFKPLDDCTREELSAWIHRRKRDNHDRLKDRMKLWGLSHIEISTAKFGQVEEPPGPDEPMAPSTQMTEPLEDAAMSTLRHTGVSRLDLPWPLRKARGEDSESNDNENRFPMRR